MTKYKVMFFIFLITSTLLGEPTQVLYLSGTGYKNTVDWDFMISDGRRCSTWTTIPVPSCWELEGFGSYNYGHDQPKSSEIGNYKYAFEIPDDWIDKCINIVFDGVMTDAKVQINGESAGAEHQGGFYRFRYDITNLVHFEEKNELRVTVSKQSANASVNRAERQADYWIFGGIFRPVRLEAFPKEHIVRTAIDAKADGSFKMKVYLNATGGAKTLKCQIKSSDGEPLGESFLIPVDSGQTNVVMQKRFDSPLLWTPEHPNLYQADISLNNGHVIHEIAQKFGFRTIAVREKDGIYVNGVKVRLKGVNRHSFWPESGRTLNKDMSIRDVNTIKNMNMNAVRMSHYPPDEHFLEACDSLGLFVLDELAGWQDAYDTCVGEKLVKEMVIRDVNHPCIIFWNNGNEGGWNPKLDDDFAKWDIQKRSVLHPWSVFNGINTTHYQDYEKYKELSKGPDIVLPTEIWHGLYDGGHGAGLEDYWKMIQDKPLAAGCFLWVYADEGIVRSDKNGMIDVDGNHAPDGILGPFHEKEGSYYSIKQVFSPVHPIRDLSSVPVDGRIQVENRYFYTNLSECTFSARLERFSGPLDYDFGIKEKRDLQVRPVSCAPGDTSFIEIDLPEDYMNFDNLSVRALDPYQREIYTWTFPVKSPYEFRVATVKTGKGNINITENQGRIRVNVKDCEYIFDRQRGRLLSVKRKDNRISFKNGPRLVAGEERSAEVSYFAHKDSCVIKVNYNSGSFKSHQWTILPSTWLKLSYTFELYGYHDFMGITFSYPEDKVKRMTWLGRGPYHVWKNRTQGVTYNIWSKDFSHVVPGKVWNYPAFKGYHSGFNWMVLETKEGTLTTMTDTKELFLRMFTANSGENPAHAKAVFPSGDVSFLHGISPIGTKFRDAVNTGPRGKMYHNQNCFNGVLYFYFDTPEM